MATMIPPKSELFLDTAYAIALPAPSDALHARAVQLSRDIEAAQASLVTTRAVLLEIGNSLCRRRFRSAAMQLLKEIEGDRGIVILPISDELYRRALALYCSRADKEWGLIDCLSFVVMSERQISLALTADVHFVQAGFHALLRENA